jgi:type II secretory ATPase GspE/PulE/Tfp pilus assembly ATPase PilB-like protein
MPGLLALGAREDRGVNILSRSVRKRDARRDRVLDRLREMLALDDSVVARGEQLAARSGQPIEQVLNQMGVVDDASLAQAYADVTGCSVWHPTAQPPVAVDPSLVQVSYLRANRLLVLGVTEAEIVVAACDPLNDEALAGLAFAAQRHVAIAIATPSDYRRHSGSVETTDDASSGLGAQALEAEAQRVFDSSAESEAARLLNGVLEAAVALGSSDIHFEPRRHDLQIRLRVDGRLVPHAVAPPALAAAAISRIKVLANLDIGERRLPQDGRATFVVRGRPAETRVSIVPTVFGEAAVLRILDRAGVTFDLADLGISTDQAEVLIKARAASHGMFLIAGPTGSGKTTTLYALLSAFADSPKKVLSVEDPVEHHFAHVRQVQVAPQIGLTFASALRAFLRHDPDVILVGEIRDSETATVAVRAAMTGHLVLASVHANDAVRVVPRLVEMGVEPYQLAACLVGAAAQRLVRRLCDDCREQRAPTPLEQTFLERYGYPAPRRVWAAKGCACCGQTGFRGRIAIAEAYLADGDLAAAIARREPAQALFERAGAAGLRPMALDGIDKALSGLTALAEIIAIIDA